MTPRAQGRSDPQGSTDRPRRAEGDRRPRSGLLPFTWAFVAIGLVVVSWTLATPLMAAPDEPTQVANAAAVVRGQIDEPIHHTYSGGQSMVHVPGWIESARKLEQCYAFKPTVPASCEPSISITTKMVDERIQFSNYPPLYYVIVGIPSLWLTGTTAVYWMRLTGDLVNCLLLALGLVLLARYHSRRLPLFGALIALSPMVLFVTSVVNDSGLEVAAAFAAWCGGLCVIEQETPHRFVTVGTSIALVLFVLARPVSPAYVAVLIVTLGLLAGWQRTRQLLGSPDVRRIAAAVAVAMGVAVVSLVIGGQPSLLGSPVKPALSALGSIEDTLRLTKLRLLQCIGTFGWLDTPVPLFTTVIWTTAAGLLLAAGLAVSSACRRALPFLILAILVAPVVFESPRINVVGTYWQGRYWLPIVMGVPLVASTFGRPATHRRSRLRLQRAAAMLVSGLILGAAQLAAFLTALHRYETGLGAKPGTPVTWTPPGGTVLVVTLLIGGQLLLVAFATVAVLRPPAWRPPPSDGTLANGSSPGQRGSPILAVRSD